MQGSFSVAGLIIGPQPHYLDHLAPLCAMMQVPLVVTEESIEKQASSFYPDLKVELEDYLTFTESVSQKYQIVFHSAARPFFDEVFFFTQKVKNKKIHTIWCPHGNSDKGHTVPFMEGLKNEEVALVYGKKMIDFLSEKGVLEHLKGIAEVGNYRHSYYLKHKTFYQNLLSDKITKTLPIKKKNILYAPTWDDAEQSSSYYDALPILIDKLPEQYNLIIKLHPNLKEQHPFKIDKLIHDLADKAQIIFIEDFPPIYPLIDFIDIYIGDASSIGYDVAFLGKPMFLLNQNNRDVENDPGMYLFRCGVEVKRHQYPDIYKIIAAYLPSDSAYFHAVREEVSKYTFGPSLSPKELAGRITNLYRLFPDEELNFY